MAKSNELMVKGVRIFQTNEESFQGALPLVDFHIHKIQDEANSDIFIVDVFHHSSDPYPSIAQCDEDHIVSQEFNSLDDCVDFCLTMNNSQPTLQGTHD